MWVRVLRAKVLHMASGRIAPLVDSGRPRESLTLDWKTVSFVTVALSYVVSRLCLPECSCAGSLVCGFRSTDSIPKTPEAGLTHEDLFDEGWVPVRDEHRGAGDFALGSEAAKPLRMATGA